MNIKLKIYDIQEYLAQVNNFDSTCYNDHYEGTLKKKFFQNLLKLSNYNCYYCGQTLITNSEKELYYEKEHIINKKYKNEENSSLKKCKYNLIPICRICNGLKPQINMSEKFISKTNDLKENSSCKSRIRKTNGCGELNHLMALMKEENFDPFDKNIEFDILNKIYIGSYNYIYQFKLNSRTSNIFWPVKKLLYTFSISYRSGLINYLSDFSNNVLDNEFIHFLEKIKLIDDKEILNPNYLNNLIETITLLEEFE